VELARTFLDDDLREWEAYVSGGRPGGARGARIYFVCLTTPLERPRFVAHESRDPAAAERELRGLNESDLAALFRTAEPIP
jgi:hypothetical protein